MVGEPKGQSTLSIVAFGIACFVLGLTIGRCEPTKVYAEEELNLKQVRVTYY